MARYCDRCPGYGGGYCEGNPEDAVKCNAVGIGEEQVNPNLPCADCPHPVKYSCMRTRDDIVQCKRDGRPMHDVDFYVCPAISWVEELRPSHWDWVPRAYDAQEAGL